MAASCDQPLFPSPPACAANELTAFMSSANGGLQRTSVEDLEYWGMLSYIGEQH